MFQPKYVKLYCIHCYAFGWIGPQVHIEQKDTTSGEIARVTESKKAIAG